ncbi:hypothetical protein [Kineococcus terrestris]|uniref:hypothetical protein n=1 Tax=Kineococcus terrestris TaxID=2044856 RepID=UPI0034DAE744
MEEWITARRPRWGVVTAGKWVGDRLAVEPDEQVPGVWHLYLTGPGHGWDIYAEDAQQLCEWLQDEDYGFRLDPE